MAKLEIPKNCVIKIIDTDLPDSSYELNKLAKTDKLAYFVWWLENNLFTNNGLENIHKVHQLVSVIKLKMEDLGIRSDELTY